MKYDPWSEEDQYEQAIEKGAVYTCPRTGWTFKLRYAAAWSPYPQRAAAIVMARPQNAEVMKKVSSGEKLTREEEAIRDRYLLETGIRSIMMGWTGVAGRDEKPLKFSLENAMLVMGHMKRLWSEVQAFAFDAKNYGIVEHPAGEIPEDVDAAGNSSATSGSASEASTAS